MEDARILKAILNLSSSPTGVGNFDLLVEWLRLQLKKTLEESIKTRESVDTRWLQGEARFIMRFLAMIDNAKEKYERTQQINQTLGDK